LNSCYDPAHVRSVRENNNLHPKHSVVAKEGERRNDYFEERICLFSKHANSSAYRTEKGNGYMRNTSSEVGRLNSCYDPAHVRSAREQIKTPPRTLRDEMTILKNGSACPANKPNPVCIKCLRPSNEFI